MYLPAAAVALPWDRGASCDPGPAPTSACVRPWTPSAGRGAIYTTDGWMARSPGINLFRWLSAV